MSFLELAGTLFLMLGFGGILVYAIMKIIQATDPQ
jgi:flagellar biogenesis protein FliO